MSGYAGKKVLVTGGTGALGQAVVEKLLAEGASCEVTWLFESELKGFSLGDQVTLHQVDCSDEAAVTKLYSGLTDLWGSIHIVGGFDMSPMTETSLEAFRRMQVLNAETCFLCCREAVRCFSGAGRIVNVSARPVVEPYGGAVAYAASKAAVASITRCLADEVKEQGVLVNAVVPSILDTPTNRDAMPDADFDSWPKVEQVAEAIAWLASPANGVTSGELMPVFGRV
ncbi:MAG TPA: short-chain dehydrogenase [Gammaproteobacteria bacterium]|nr:short-chain dehydrogenase [Gammaproteobacteria bacterium]